MNIPGVGSVTLSVIYCDKQYPNGPPTQPTPEEASMNHVNSPAGPIDYCWLVGGSRGGEGESGEPDAFGGRRVLATGFLRCGVCDGYIRRKVIEE